MISGNTRPRRRCDRKQLVIWADGEERAVDKAELAEFFTSSQKDHKTTNEENCPLCNLELENEHIRHKGEGFIVVDTLKKKGHKERIMLVIQKHGVNHPKPLLDKAIDALMEVGTQIFQNNFCLLSDKFSSTSYHWHIVASDLDLNSDDHKQMLETPFVLVKKRN